MHHGGFGGGKGNIRMHIIFEHKMMSYTTGSIIPPDPPFNPIIQMKDREVKYDTKETVEICDNNITKMLD